MLLQILIIESGGRQLGIPTVVDRMKQPAIQHATGPEKFNTSIAGYDFCYDIVFGRLRFLADLVGAVSVDAEGKEPLADGQLNVATAPSCSWAYLTPKR